jgi:Bacterial Ig-like domain
MMTSSINTKTFKLFENGSTTKVAATLSYQPSTDTTTLDPTASLKSGVSYKAVLTTGARDVAGNPLDQNTTTTGLQQKSCSAAGAEARIEQLPDNLKIRIIGHVPACRALATQAARLL